jgi:hypothetical protein
MNSLNPFRHRIPIVAFLALALPMQMWGGNNTWISGNGMDGNPCTNSSPCATFTYASQIAYNNNSANGEVFVLNPGVYDTTTAEGINFGKSQTWDGGDGNLATIVGINITIGISFSSEGLPGFTSSNVFILRNLTLIGEGFAGPAIQVGSFFNGATLIIENCKIYGFAPPSGTGVIDCSGGGNVIIKNTIIESNVGDAINIFSSGNVSLSELAIKNNTGNGLNISAGAVVDISDSVITQNTGTAILAAGSGTTINCVNNVLTSNATAIGVGTSALVRISNNDIYNNTSFIDYIDDTGLVNTANNNRTGSNGSSPTSPTGSITLQ